MLDETLRDSRKVNQRKKPTKKNGESKYRKLTTLHTNLSYFEWKKKAEAQQNEKLAISTDSLSQKICISNAKLSSNECRHQQSTVLSETEFSCRMS